MRSQMKKMDFPDRRLSSVDDGMGGGGPIPGCPEMRGRSLCFPIRHSKSISSSAIRIVSPAKRVSLLVSGLHSGGIGDF